MRKALLLFAVVSTLFSFTALGFSNPDAYRWSRVQEKYWVGKIDGKTYYLRLDRKLRLTRSVDKTHWELLNNNNWTDNTGNQLSFVGGRLMQRENEQGSLKQLREQQWIGTDGLHYKLDDFGNVWVRSAIATE